MGPRVRAGEGSGGRGSGSTLTSLRAGDRSATSPTRPLTRTCVDERLSPRVRALVADRDNTLFGSAASAWEIATKHRLGKLAVPAVMWTAFGEHVGADGFESLSITSAHSVRAGAFVTDHRDPFDRMLAAQALVDDPVLLTRDPAFGQFGCATNW